MTTAPADDQWDELLEDATAIAEEYRDDGWDAVVLEPERVVPVDDETRIGFDVRVSDDEYDLVAALIEDGDVTITAADVYYRPPENETDRRIALAVERDEETETAVFVPLTYDVEASRSVFETALEGGELLAHVIPESAGDGPENWLTFSHDDPSLFLEADDLEG
ncbi:hypothetical protein RBH26_17960 [Natronolimnohabitans sp. A-GB9]|uniref:DUF7529 family protein n=1 Tax=Natronolimnohabitans sp. A-GB9 TaxID=3069757 RepID=UPI0027B1F407|nr:hypothetical protein [Natronolimnohabitans sp. A-GB9]MDQ2052356.1 hypothetical protein [Natronolimnohabitans sp. A-GB9]